MSRISRRWFDEFDISAFVFNSVENNLRAIAGGDSGPSTTVAVGIKQIVAVIFNIGIQEAWRCKSHLNVAI